MRLWMFIVLCCVGYRCYASDVLVKIQAGESSYCLEIKGPYRVYDRDTHTLLNRGLVKTKAALKVTAEGIMWKQLYPVTALEICVDKGRSFFLNGIEYKGNLIILQEQDSLVMLNKIQLEDFLKSATAYATSLPESDESCAAWVICQRSYLYHLAQKGALSDEEHHYYGYGVTKAQRRLEKMIDWTKDIVLSQPVNPIEFSTDKADLLASKGYDAKKILDKMYPHYALCAVTQDVPKQW